MMLYFTVTNVKLRTFSVFYCTNCKYHHPTLQMLAIWRINSGIIWMSNLLQGFSKEKTGSD